MAAGYLDGSGRTTILHTDPGCASADLVLVAVVGDGSQ